jgi:hypothetical protein
MTQKGLTHEEWKFFGPIHACNDLIGYRIVPELLHLRKLHADVANAADMTAAMVMARKFRKRWDKLVDDLSNLKKRNVNFVMNFAEPDPLPSRKINNERSNGIKPTILHGGVDEFVP